MLRMKAKRGHVFFYPAVKNFFFFFWYSFQTRADGRSVTVSVGILEDCQETRSSNTAWYCCCLHTFASMARDLEQQDTCISIALHRENHRL